MPDLNKSIQPDSQIWFLSGTGIENYENQIDFRHTGVQRQFMYDHLLFTVNNYRYLRKEQAIRIEKNVEECYNIDYCFYKNRNFGDRTIYCFVTDVNYINDSTTEITVEVDAWQTFMWDIEFQKCFVTNKHMQEFKNNIVDPANALVQNNLLPENLEYGDKYMNVHTESYHWKSYKVLIGSAVNLEADWGTKDNPDISSSNGGIYEHMPSMLTYYLCNTGAFNGLMQEMSDYPWIAQNIQFVSMIPDDFLPDGSLTKVTIKGRTLYRLKDSYVSPDKDLFTINDPLLYFGKKQKHAKLYRYPYSYIEMTGYNGQHFIIRPEMLHDISKLSITCISYVNNAPRFGVYVKNYADYTDNGFKIGNTTVGQGDFLDCGIVFGDFPQIPVLVDNAILYQAQNANSFALNNIIAQTNKQDARKFGLIEGIGGAFSNVLRGNIGGAIGSIYGSYKKVYETDKQNDFAIRRQMAKIQDAEITPPTLAGQTGGDGFNIANEFGGVTLKWKTIHPRYIDRLNDFFERYGYNANVFEVPVLRTNERFNYIKTQGCIIKANIPKYYANIIQDMFDKGTTLWHDGDIGVYDSNEYTE